LRYLGMKAGGGEHVDAVLHRIGRQVVAQDRTRLAAGSRVAGDERDRHAVMTAKQRIQARLSDRLGSSLCGRCQFGQQRDHH